MSKSQFEEMASNDPRGALLALYAELVAAQETIVELSAAVHAQ